MRWSGKRSDTSATAGADMPKGRKGRRARSRQLLKLAWRVTRLDRRMLVFPAVAATSGLLITAIICALFVDVNSDSAPPILLPAIIASAPLTLITIACGVGTASLVADVLDGREPSVERAWALIRRRGGVIVAWTLVMWTIGALLKILEDRLPLGGRIVAFVLDLGFGLATLFAVPVLAFEGLGPRATFTRSAALTRERFGTLVGGSVAIGVGSAVAYVPAILLILAGAAAASPAAIVVLVSLGVGWILAAGAFFTSLDYVFRTVLYRDTLGLPSAAAGLGPDDFRAAIGPA